MLHNNGIRIPIEKPKGKLLLEKKELDPVAPQILRLPPSAHLALAASMRCLRRGLGRTPIPSRWVSTMPKAGTGLRKSIRATPRYTTRFGTLLGREWESRRPSPPIATHSPRYVDISPSASYEGSSYCTAKSSPSLMPTLVRTPSSLWDYNAFASPLPNLLGYLGPPGQRCLLRTWGEVD